MKESAGYVWMKDLYLGSWMFRELLKLAAKDGVEAGDLAGLSIEFRKDGRTISGLNVDGGKNSS